MLAQRPPAIVVHLLEVLLRTVEQRDILSHPFRRLRIRDGRDDILVFHRIEIVGIVGIVVIVEDGSNAAVYSTGNNIRNGEGSLLVTLVSTRHIEVLIGRCVDIGLVERHSRTEHDTTDALHRRVKLSLAGFLAVQVIDGPVQRDRKYRLDMIGRPCLITLEQGTVSGTALHTDNTRRVHDNTGTHIPCIIHELNIQLPIGILGRFHVKLHFQFLGIGNQALCFRIVVGITVAQLQPRSLKGNGSPLWGVNVPVSQFRQLSPFVEGCRMRGCLHPYRHGNTTHPHILLIIGISDPKVFGKLRVES